MYWIMYKSVNKISPLFVHNFFETLTAVHQYDTGQTSKGDIIVS